MTGTLKTTLIRERRRLCFVGLVAFCSGMIFYQGIDLWFFGLPAPIFIGFLYALFTTLGAFAVLHWSPGLTSLVEPLALSRLCVAVYVFANPQFGNAILASPGIMALLVVCGAIFIRRGMARPSPVSVGT